LVKRFATLNLPSALVLLATFTAIVAIVAGWYAFSRSGPIGVVAVASAAVTCGVASIASLILSASWRNTPQAVTGVLGAVLVRMTLPLGVAVLSQVVGGPIAQAGLFGWIVCFFLTTLVVETLLVVRLLNSPRTATARASKGS
jgi:hypothetical protein